MSTRLVKFPAHASLSIRMKVSEPPIEIWISDDYTGAFKCRDTYSTDSSHLLYKASVPIQMDSGGGAGTDPSDPCSSMNYAHCWGHTVAIKNLNISIKHFHCSMPVKEQESDKNRNRQCTNHNTSWAESFLHSLVWRYHKTDIIICEN